jgi:hypothetical protein
MDMGFWMWNVRSLSRAGLLKTGATKLEEYKLYLVTVQEVSWEKDGNEQADDCTFLYGNRNPNHH